MWFAKGIMPVKFAQSSFIILNKHTSVYLNCFRLFIGVLSDVNKAELILDEPDFAHLS